MECNIHMEKSFFKLPLIGCLIYFMLSILFNVFFLYLHADEFFLGNFTWYVFFDVPFSFLLRLFFEHYFTDTLLIFGLLTLFFHSAHVYIVNKVNITLLIIIMSVYSIVTYLIKINTTVYLKTVFSLLPIFPIALAIIHYLLNVLLLYYLIVFCKGYFIKSQNEFILTKKDSPNIHFVLFSIFSCFILIKCFIFMKRAFSINVFSGSIYNHLTAIYNHLMVIYLVAILFGLVFSKQSFHVFFDKIQYVKLFKSVLISNVLILSIALIAFIIIYNNPSKYYFDSFISIFDNINKLLLVILLISLICLTINKTTKYYFGKAAF